MKNRIPSCPVCFKIFENKFDKYLDKDSVVENCESTKREIREEIIDVTDFEKFRRLELQDENITFAISVCDGAAS